MDDQAPEEQAPVGWRKKKRLCTFNARHAVERAVITKKRRSPSHVTTQSRDPGYKRVRLLCDSLYASAHTGDTAKQRYDACCERLLSFVADAGMPLLERVENSKVLADLVGQCFSHALSWADRELGDKSVLENIVKCFPSSGNDRNYNLYKSRISHVITREHEIFAARDALARKEEEKRGITRVTWDDSDDDVSNSGMYYGLTGGAGHMHGGPGL